MFSVKYIPVVVFMVCGWMGSGLLSETLAAEGVTITVQGVQALPEGDSKKPTIAASLLPYQSILKRFEFGTYNDFGKDTKVVPVGGQKSLTVGKLNVTVKVLKKDGKGVKIHYLIMDGKKKAGEMSTTLKAGKAKPVQVLEPKKPVILLFKLGK